MQTDRPNLPSIKPLLAETDCLPSSGGNTLNAVFTSWRSSNAYFSLGQSRQPSYGPRTYGHRRHYSESMKASYPFTASVRGENGAWCKQPSSAIPLPNAMNQTLALPNVYQQYGQPSQVPFHITAIDLSMQARPNLAPANNSGYSRHAFQRPQMEKRNYTHGRSLSDYSHHMRPESSTAFVQSHRRAISATTSEYIRQTMDEEEEVESERSGSASPPSQFADSPADTGRYACPYCQKLFSRPSSLRIHTYSHTGEKPFQCLHPGCDRKFSVQSNMRRHLRVHKLGTK
ncbi:unnamed protein product [Umbelopsis vinacea]